ncbi:hypothetical protein DRH29_00960 [candidate division Kazan bacterium]|uniref:Uncharacterized protein n=1 Tax=candidate division Kazan bacterium TaxID=2202143 RepID=A0A420ZDD1_UNCK3|nr:MAG: hypothetical protein DRH29_00960 [candidate division Kazan bacterium]
MEQTPKQQIVELIKKAQNILIAPSQPDGDSLGSSLALLLVLKKMGKKVSLRIDGSVKPSYQFLPGVKNINSEDASGARDFIITLSSSTAEAEKLSYTMEDGKLNIIITPKKGSYRPEDASFKQGQPKYDIIIVLDAAVLTQLGETYSQSPALFKEVPVINIDHHASNSFFGTVNLVDMTSSSTAEILIGLIEALGSDLINEDVATCLLTGIIADTGSFQNANTSPKSLTVAAQMVGFGARHQEIIKNLFKTKTLPTLKLWGQVLSGVQVDAEKKFAWGVASLQDLKASGATKEDFAGLIDSLMTSIPGVEVVLLLTEREPNIIYGSIRTTKGVDAVEIANLFGGGGHPGAAAFQMLDMTIDQALPIVIEKISAYQSDRLALKSAPQEEKITSTA